MSHAQNVGNLQDEALNSYIAGEIESATQLLQSAVTQAETLQEAAETDLATAKTDLARTTRERDEARTALGDAPQVITELNEQIGRQASNYLTLENKWKADVAEIGRLTTELARVNALLKELTPVVTAPLYKPTNGYPTYHIKDIRQGTEDIDVTLARGVAGQPFINVELDPELYEFSDFKYARSQTARQAYGILAPKVMDLFSPRGEAVIQIRPKTSTIGHYVPLDGTSQITGIRIGPEQGAVHALNITFSGTDQGHLYNGWNTYMADRGLFQKCKVVGTAGDASYPPGETFMWNDYRTTNTTYEDCKSYGFQCVYSMDPTTKKITFVKGLRKGGSPFGTNASRNVKRVNFEGMDSYVSGITTSFAGQPDTGTKPYGLTAINDRSIRNANHEGNTSKKTFNGLNHEGAMGPIRHYGTYLDMINTSQQSPHIFIANAAADNPDIEFHDITYTTGPDWAAGALGVQVPAKYWEGRANKQTSLPKVFKNGKQLQPLRWLDTQPKLTNVDPNTHYVAKVS